MAHLTVLGGTFGGGERAAQSIFEYSVPAAVFPPDAHYVALGHLHRRQALAAPVPVHYSGAPLAVDFGEQDNTSVVLLVEATPTTPARVTEIPITAGRRLRTVHGTVAELAGMGGDLGDDLLRVVVRERARAGLREEVTELLPNALEVRIDPEFAASVTGSRPSTGGADRSPGELFREYLGTRAVDDRRVEELFARLHDRIGDISLGAGRAPDAAGAAGDGGVRGIPRARRRRLHRGGVLRAGRADGVRKVHGDRRADVRPVRHRAALGRPASRGAGARAERGPGCRAAGVRRPGRSATSPSGSCAAPRAVG